MSELYGLRVKIKALAAEARIIRSDEQALCFHRHKFYTYLANKRLQQRSAELSALFDKHPRRALLKARREAQAAVIPEWIKRNESAREEMYRHRTIKVREEARASQLAYGYLRRRSYRQMEPMTRESIVNQRQLIETIASMAYRYGTVAKKDALETIKKWLSADSSVGMSPQPTEPDKQPSQVAD